MDNDIRIAFAMIPLSLITLLSLRTGYLTPEDFAVPVLILVIFGPVAARHYRTRFSTITIILDVLWLLGFVWFYAEAWFPTMRGGGANLSHAPIVGVLGYIFFDYVRRQKQIRHRFLLGAVLAGVVVCFTITDVIRYKSPNELLELIARVVSLGVSVMIASAYWCVLAGREVQWFWRRRSTHPSS